MSEVPPIPEPTDTPPEGEPKTFDEAYVKKLRDEAATHRTAAKANAKAAEELAAIKKAQQTDAERAATDLAEARSEAETARTEALRYRVAAKHGIEDEDAALFLTGTDEETITKQAERLVGREKERKKQGGVVPLEGTNPPTPPTNELTDFTKQLFGRTT